MIRLSINDFGIHDDIDTLKNHLFIIENKKYLYNFLNDMYSGCTVKEYVKVFDDGYRQLKNLDYVDFIPSLVHIDINNKKNINALVRYLKKVCSDEMEEYSHKINFMIEELFAKIKLESPIDIISDINFTDDDLFKSFNLSIFESKESLIERINNYISLSFELRNIKVFIFYALFSFLEQEEVALLIKNCQYKGIIIINIENFDVNLGEFDIKKKLDLDNCLIE